MRIVPILASGVWAAGLTSAHAAVHHPEGVVAALVGDGLLAQLLYLPAGLLLAAVVLEISARQKKSKSLHTGVLALLVGATAAAVTAVGASIASPDSTAPLTGSAFANADIGVFIAIIIVLAAISKWLQIRTQISASVAVDSAPKSKPKRRGRGRIRGKRKSKKTGTIGAGLAMAANWALGLTLTAATAGALLAGPFLNSPVQRVDPAIVDNTETEPEPSEPETAAVHPVESASPDPVEPDMAKAVTEPVPVVVAKIEPEPEMVHEPEVVATAPEPMTPEPEPKPETVASTPTPTQTRGSSNRPVSMQKGGLAGVETYEKLVQPILRSRCYSCHGDEKQKGDLRLDTPESIRAGGKSGAVIIAGNPEGSYLFELISLDASDDDIMPPKGKPLSAAQISWIGGWIREGAALGDGVDWPVAEGGNGSGLAIDALTAGVAATDGNAVQKLLNGGVIVRELSSDGKLLEIDYSHSNRAAGDLRLEELLPLAGNIHTLDLKRTKITDADLKTVASLKNLRILHLQRTKIGDAALQHLSGLEQLESLNLYNTKISDAAIPELKKMTSLKKIFLWSTQVTADGARELSSVLGAGVVNMGE